MKRNSNTEQTVAGYGAIFFLKIQRERS